MYDDPRGSQVYDDPRGSQVYDDPRLGTPTAMTTPNPEGSPVKDPADWATGDEPATASQLSYLETLAQDSGSEVPTDVTKAQASQLIDELQNKSPRVSGIDSPDRSAD